jgi:D-alanine-D-alanine ligase
MRIGITFDLKDLSVVDGGRWTVDGGDRTAVPSPSTVHHSPSTSSLPDDYQEEFDSPETIEAIAEVLRGLGHEVVKLGDGRELLQRLLTDPPDFVFNIAEGQGIGRSREARVPAVLEMLGIPFTGSDPLTLAVTLDKDCAKRLVASEGVIVPRSILVEEWRPATAAKLRETLRFPIILKPAWEGSSKGIRQHCIVDDVESLPSILASIRHDHRQPILIEEYIQGDELTVGVIGNEDPQVIGVMRVLPQQPTARFIYSLEVKRDWRRQVRYECPARLPDPVLAAVKQAALTSYRVLGCRDVSRIDFRLRDGVPYFLEVNPLPGLNPETGDLVIMSKSCGWTYPGLIAAILQAARSRHSSSAPR